MVVGAVSKRPQNQRKHGLSFAEARQLFESGADYLEIFDVEHSELEDRLIAIGPIDRGLVVVIYTEREEDSSESLAHGWPTRTSRPCTARTWINTDD